MVTIILISSNRDCTIRLSHADGINQKSSLCKACLGAQRGCSCRSFMRLVPFQPHPAEAQHSLVRRPASLTFFQTVNIKTAWHWCHRERILHEQQLSNLLDYTCIMWLIDTTWLKLHDFSRREKPSYGILSHTWAKDEPSFQYFQTQQRPAQATEGFQKIVETCRLAKNDGLCYVWIDTVCIDKTSSAALSEAINSMFRYYQQSAKCYTYLVDLMPTSSTDRMFSCRWFTRGWTLQELIAPDVLEFYDSGWISRGRKHDHAYEISRRTDIPEVVLQRHLESVSYTAAEKMSWASGRRTSRREDTAYCLLGLFDINMPLLYGEGNKAFRRLQEEVLRKTGDLTLLAHRMCDSSPRELLASSPEGFKTFRYLTRPANQRRISNVTITPHGLILIGYTMVHYSRDDYFLCLEQDDQYAPFKTHVQCDEIFILLDRIGPSHFRISRKNVPGEVTLGLGNRVACISIIDCHLYAGTSWRHEDLQLKHWHHHKDITIGKHSPHKVKRVVPSSLWDPVNRIVYNGPDEVISVNYWEQLVVAAEFDIRHDSMPSYSVCVLLRRSLHGSRICSVFLIDEYPRQARMLLSGKDARSSVRWADVEYLMPELINLPDHVIVQTPHERLRLHAFFSFHSLEVCVTICEPLMTGTDLAEPKIEGCV